jgi:SAM-dependent methyltransferase
MSNVNDTYFDGSYKDIWRSVIPAELTIKEVDFMMSWFGLKPGDKVLDLMCGYGRHAIALAKKELAVTAVDNLDDYITEINKIAKDEGLTVKAIKADILQYKIDDKYDLALCMGNSLNFFNAKDVHHLLINIHSHLKPGGHLLINTWSLAEIAIKSFITRSWDEVNSIKHICESKYLFHPTRIESDSIFLSPDGSIEKKKAIDYIFSVAEMEKLLNNAGFTLNDIYSIPGKKKFTIGEPRAYIVAEKS